MYRCDEIYGGNCTVLIGPPSWSHGRGSDAGEDPHPTFAQALQAAEDPNTPRDVLVRLAEYDAKLLEEVRTAARNNPAYREV